MDSSSDLYLKPIYRQSPSGPARLVPAPLRQHFRLALSVAMILFILSAIYSVTAYVPTYSSAASVVIKNSPLTTNYLTTDNYATSTSSLANPVLNTMELLKGKTIGKALWEQMLVKHPEELKKMKLETMSEWLGLFGDGKSFIKARNIPGTDVIYLNFRWSSPQIAQEGMGIVLKAFMQASQEQNQSEHRQRAEYMTRQANDLKRRLFTIREEVALFKRTHDIYNLESTLTTLEQNRSALEQSTRAASADAQNYGSQLSAYESTLGMNTKKAVAAAAIGRSSTLSPMYNKLYEMTAERNSLRARYTPEHLKIKQLDSQISQVRQDIQSETVRNGVISSPAAAGDTKTVDGTAVIADETRGVAVTNMLEVQARFKGAKAQSAQLRSSLSTLESKIRDLPAAEAKLMNLKQDENSISTALDVLEQKSLEAKMREMQTLSNVFPLTEPSDPGSSQFPNRNQLMILGLLIGIATGVATAFGADYLGRIQKFDGEDNSDELNPNLALKELVLANQQQAEPQRRSVVANGMHE